jgi:hypothetical protein|nr:MAG TPA: hypothetical protein [Caudoviricetes sp.]
MGKKKSNNGRKFVTCDVIGKKIKFPKKLRNKITSYRRIGYGPNERDVLIGEIVNDKYLVFPLDKEMDLDNSELYIIERTPGSIEEDDKPDTVDVVDAESKDEVPTEKVSQISESLYTPLGLRSIASLPSGSFFKYDGIIWTKVRTGKRTFVDAIDLSVRFSDYLVKKLGCSNPYSKMKSIMVEQLTLREPEEKEV